MRRVAPHLLIARTVVVSNVWLLEEPAGGRFLVDTGHALERPALRASLWRAGVRGRGDLTAVLLTHRHSDHAGNAQWLRDTFDCPIACHTLDAAILMGRAPRPKLARGVGRLHEEVLSRIEDRFPARTPVDEVYADGEWKWGFRMMHAPGHTEGSVVLHHEPTGTLFSGDVILTGLPTVPGFELMRLAVPGFSLQTEECHRAVREIVNALPPTKLIAAGHGPVVTRGVEAKLRALVSR